MVITVHKKGSCVRVIVDRLLKVVQDRKCLCPSDALDLRSKTLYLSCRPMAVLNLPTKCIASQACNPRVEFASQNCVWQKNIAELNDMIPFKCTDHVLIVLILQNTALLLIILTKQYVPNDCA